MGAPAEQVALTRATTDGADAVLTGFPLDPDSIVLTSDEEHPGLLGPLAGACKRAGAQIKLAPFGTLVSRTSIRPRPWSPSRTFPG